MIDYGVDSPEQKKETKGGREKVHLAERTI